MRQHARQQRARYHPPFSRPSVCQPSSWPWRPLRRSRRATAPCAGRSGRCASAQAPSVLPLLLPGCHASRGSPPPCPRSPACRRHIHFLSDRQNVPHRCYDNSLRKRFDEHVRSVILRASIETSLSKAMQRCRCNPAIMINQQP